MNKAKIVTASAVAAVLLLGVLLWLTTQKSTPADPAAQSPAPTANVTDPAADEGPASQFVAPSPISTEPSVTEHPEMWGATTDAQPGDILPEHPGIFDDNRAPFELADGTYLIVDTTAPLPPVVVSATDTAAAAALASSTEPGEQVGALEEFTATTHAGTGRIPIVVTTSERLVTANADAAPGWVYWVQVGSSSYISAVMDKALIRGAVDEWIAAQEEPSLFFVVTVA